MTVLLSIRRWVDLFVYAVGGIAVGFVAATLTPPLLEIITSSWPQRLSLVGGWLFFGACILLLVPCVKVTGFRWRQLRYFWSYPPLLVSVLIAWTVVLILAEMFPNTLSTIAPSASGAATRATIGLWIIFGVLLPLALRRGPTRAADRRSSAKTRDELRELTLGELLKWLADERPIAIRTEDYFGADDRASQIWEAIRERRSAKSSLMQTVVIEGPFGSGKSGIVELLARRIEEEQPERFILARVSAWGFSSSAARQYVLEQALEALRMRVDCTALRKLPKSYMEALSQCAKWLSAVFLPWSEEATPVQRLQSITPILKAIDAHLIIVIEDSDRAASDFDPAHLQAMLHDFRQVEHLSFILTVGSTARIDYPKLAEQIITVSPVALSDAAFLLDRIRDYCRKEWRSTDLIADTLNRPQSLLAETEAIRAAAQVFFWRIRWPHAVAELLNTPRQLKFVLSSILRSWKRLAGEVDLDELIIMTALRHAASPVFSFVLRRSYDLRFLRMQDANESADDKTQREREYAELRSEWHQVVAESKANSRALDVLLCNLFPKAFAITHPNSSNQTNRVQSLHSPRGDAYLERIVAGSVPYKAVRDQTVLDAFLKVARGEAFEAFATEFVNSREFAEIAIFFDKSEAILVPQENRKRVTEVLIQTMSSLFPQERFESFAVHDLFSKWHGRINRGGVEFPAWAITQITKFIPASLLHATEVYSDLIHDDFVELEKEAIIRQAVVAAVRDRLSVISMDEFAQSFPRDFPYTLDRLFHLDRQRKYPSEFLTDYSQWTWMKEMLLDAGERHPENIIPQLVHEFGDYGPKGDVYSIFKFRDSDVLQYFGESTPRFYALIRRRFVTDSKLDPNFKRLIPLAQQQAEQWRSN
jgi:thymidylate kinase